MMRYSFGGDTGQSYEKLRRQRAAGDALMQQTSNPQNVGEGISSAVQSIAGALIARKADEQLSAFPDEFRGHWPGTWGNPMSGILGASGLMSLARGKFKGGV